ncbi:MAG: Gfo/Idh/MocA family oxidoreductase [Caldilineaceae bacterium]
MPAKIRWGILAPGTIARKFAAGLQTAPDAEITAVGARSQESADRFGDEFNVPRRHQGYEKLAADPNVDVIYVASPHALHMEQALLCLDHGKAVLCEKPFTINAAQAQAVIERARARQLFVMEAMWSRFIPLIAAVRKMVSDGVIGDLRMVNADFGFRTRFNPQSRLFDPAVGGGGLLDVGVYAVSFASMLLGTPNRVASMAEIGETGVDEQGAAILGYPGGELAMIYTGVRTQTPLETTIMGTDGMIQIHNPSWAPTKMTVKRSGQAPELVEMPFEGSVYTFQIDEVQRCLSAGKLESAIMPLDETLSIMTTMDQIRAQWGVRYPME